VLQLGSSIRSIFNMVVIAVVDAQAKNKSKEATLPATQDEIKKPKWWKSRKKAEGS
jgi:malate dehydrogenase (oxaloacetate-decarboxylating)(NADP+)